MTDEQKREMVRALDQFRIDNPHAINIRLWEECFELGVAAERKRCAAVCREPIPTQWMEGVCMPVESQAMRNVPKPSSEAKMPDFCETLHGLLEKEDIP